MLITPGPPHLGALQAARQLAARILEIAAKLVDQYREVELSPVKAAPLLAERPQGTPAELCEVRKGAYDDWAQHDSGMLRLDRSASTRCCGTGAGHGARARQKKKLGCRRLHLMPAPLLYRHGFQRVHLAL